MKITCIKNKNIDVKFILDETAFIVTVVNQTLPSLHGGSLEITLQVTLKYYSWVNE